MYNEHFSSTKEITRCLHKGPNQGGIKVFTSEDGDDYYDLTSSHCAITGSTSFGKTQSVLIDTVKAQLQNDENLIVLDPKKEIYQSTIKLAKKSHDIIVFDFSDFYSSKVGWNPLQLIYTWLFSDEPKKQDRARELLGSFCASLYPLAPEERDPFWQRSSADYIEGITLALLCLIHKGKISTDYLNVFSILAILDGIGNNAHSFDFFLNQLDESNLNEAIALEYIRTFTESPNETRSSIYAVTNQGLNIFRRSFGLLDMLSNAKERSMVDISKIQYDDNEKPLCIFITLPYQNNAYIEVCAHLLEQLLTHAISQALDNHNGTFKKRLNIVLEECGSVGTKVLPLLDTYLAISRSSNLRFIICAQSWSQLESAYGLNVTRSIKDNIGIEISFSHNDISSLEEISKKFGYKNGTNDIATPLLSPSQIAALPIGSAAVLLHHRLKYVSHFSYHDYNYYDSPSKNMINTSNLIKRDDLFNYTKWREEKTTERVAEILSGTDNSEAISTEEQQQKLVAKIDQGIAKAELNQIEMHRRRYKFALRINLLQSSDKNIKELNQCIRNLLDVSKNTADDLVDQAITEGLVLPFETKHKATMANIILRQCVSDISISFIDADDELPF